MSLRGPSITTGWKLTGKARWQPGWFGRCLVYVEEVRKVGYASVEPVWTDEVRQWRRARISDLLTMREWEFPVC